MRIGIDARQLCGRTTGVGRYLLGLLLAWAAPSSGSRPGGASDHEFILYMPQASDALAGLDARRFQPRIVPGGGGTWWEQMSLPRIANADRLDVFFARVRTGGDGSRSGSHERRRIGHGAHDAGPLR